MSVTQSLTTTDPRVIILNTPKSSDADFLEIGAQEFLISDRLHRAREIHCQKQSYVIRSRNVPNRN